MKIEAKIQKWGNGLAIRVGGPMRDIPNFKNGTLVDVEISEDGFTVKKHVGKPLFTFTEEELLSNLSPKSAHANLLANLNDSEFEY